MDQVGTDENSKGHLLKARDAEGLGRTLLALIQSRFEPQVGLVILLQQTSISVQDHGSVQQEPAITAAVAAGEVGLLFTVLHVYEAGHQRHLVSQGHAAQPSQRPPNRGLQTRELSCSLSRLRKAGSIVPPQGSLVTHEAGQAILRRHHELGAALGRLLDLKVVDLQVGAHGLKGRGPLLDPVFQHRHAHHILRLAGSQRQQRGKSQGSHVW
mmetsp:Transcript_64720/g.106373  ORF Transcript_64720/g.106373 Transcript_64720/m.106373 type:complete len:212 (+) Transcript_64720:786-1421(+)